MKIAQALLPAVAAVALLGSAAPAASAAEPVPPSAKDTMALTYESTLDMTPLEPGERDELTPRERETLAAVLPFVASLFS